jgi:stage V sporulation protein SpoVS
MSTKSKSTRTAQKPSTSKPRAKSTASTKNSRQTAEAKTTGASKLDQIVSALTAPSGAPLQTLMDLTGWQAHSVRGALAGSLKVKRGLSIGSELRDGVRFYCIADQK